MELDLGLEKKKQPHRDERQWLERRLQAVCDRFDLRKLNALTRIAMAMEEETTTSVRVGWPESPGGLLEVRYECAPHDGHIYRPGSS